MKRTAGSVGGVALVVITLVIAGAAAFEIYLRSHHVSFNPAYFEEDIPFIHRDMIRREGLYQWDPLLFWKYRPSASSQINSLGFRDREFSSEKKTQFRILTLGDSCAAGHQLPSEKTYSRYLERLLNDGPGSRRYEVINAGVPGYSSLQGLRFFRILARKYHPDLVLVSFGANDRGKARFADKELSYGKLVALSFFRGVVENSRAVQFFVERMDYFNDARWITRVSPDDYKKNLLMLAGEAQAMNIKLIFIKSCLRREIELASEDNTYMPPEPYMSLFEVLLKPGDGAPEKVFFDSKHFTELGHQLIAQAIYEKLITPGVGRKMDRQENFGTFLEDPMSPLGTVPLRK